MLVKLTRNEPEIKGGKTVAYLPEESVQKALDKGWKRASNNETSVDKSANNSPKVDNAQKEDFIGEKKNDFVENKTISKTVSRKKTSSK